METRQQHYRAVSAVAVASLVFGLLSVLTVFHWALAAIPLVGILLSWLALGRIHENPGELTGRWQAIAGLAASVLLGTLGLGWLLFAHGSEVPTGYQRVSYEMLQPDPKKKDERVSQTAVELEGKRVFIKGYMYPGRQQVGLKQFILCPAIPDCPFCTPDPKPTEMILIKLEGDLVTRYTTHLVRLGGRLHVDRTATDGLPYRLNADYLR